MSNITHKIITHKISDAGNGFPEIGERVYCSAENAVYIVESFDSRIQTRQWEANHVLATLKYECDPTDLDDDEFESIRECRVEAI